MENTTNFCNQLSNAATTRSAAQELEAFANECTQEYLTDIVERYFIQLQELILKKVQKGNYTVENGKRIVIGSWLSETPWLNFRKKIPYSIYNNLNENDIENFNTPERHIYDHGDSGLICFEWKVSDKKVTVEKEYYMGFFIKRKKKKSVEIGQPCFNGLSKQFFSALSNRALKEGIELLPEISIYSSGHDDTYDYHITSVKFDNPTEISLQAINNSEQYVECKESSYYKTKRLKLKEALCEMYRHSQINFQLLSIHYRVVF